MASIFTTLCVYPMTTIYPTVTELTGLDNYNLTGQVAHNGNKYDFPLLQAELHKIGGSLSSDLLCCDSWLGITEILYNKHNRDQESKKEKNFEEKEVEVVDNLIDKGEFQEILEPPILEYIESQEQSCKTPPRSSSSPLLTPPSSIRKREVEEGKNGEAISSGSTGD